MLTSFATLLTCSASLRAQDTAAQTQSPVAIERVNAEAVLTAEQRIAHSREVLRGPVELRTAPLVVRALVLLGAGRDPADLALIARFVGDLDSGVSAAAMRALRQFGSEGLAALNALSAEEIDPTSRRKAVEVLVQDHIRKCCQRDIAVNPLRLSFKRRFDELDALGLDLNDAMFKLLRASVGDIREDLTGMRYYYYNPNQSAEPAFISWGALAVAALAERKPEQLMREFGELAQVEADQQNWYWGYRQYAPVTLELATFFARQGKPALVDRLISDIESGNRGRGVGGNELAIQVPVAAMQSNALGEHKAALERLDLALRTAAASDDAFLTQAHYLRARILTLLSEQGEALYALEECMESSSNPMLLVLVDDAFAAIADDRRFRTVIEYCRLTSRAANAIARPYTGTTGTED